VLLFKIYYNANKTFLTKYLLTMEAAAATAILGNPDQFAEAAKKFVEAQGEFIKNMGKAIDVLKAAR
jgi:hypothetical protein